MTAALTLLLAGTLLVAAALKLRDPDDLVVVLRQLATRRRPGVVAARAATRALAVVEVLVAAALLLGAGSALPAVAAALLLVALSVALRTAAARAPTALANCHCFGAAGDAPPAQGLARNALLVAGSAAVALAPPGTLWDLDADELAGAATVAVGLACAWQLSTLAWRLRPGAAG
jgi:uncharacterized membrane protein YphA (DoxX/SURF4 family)